MSKVLLKSLLNNLINENHTEADLDFHNYLTSKMKEVAGTAEASLSEEEVEEILESATEEELVEAVRAYGTGSNNPDDWRPRTQAERNELAKAVKAQRESNRKGNGGGPRAGAGSAMGTTSTYNKDGGFSDVQRGKELPGWDKSRPNERHAVSQYKDKHGGVETVMRGNATYARDTRSTGAAKATATDGKGVK